MVDDDKKINGKFQICLIIKEFIDTGETVILHPFVDYAEACWGWEDAKKTIKFFMKRAEKKLMDEI